MQNLQQEHNLSIHKISWGESQKVQNLFFQSEPALKFYQKMKNSRLYVVIRILGRTKVGKSTLGNHMLKIFAHNQSIINGIFTQRVLSLTSFNTIYFYNPKIQNGFFKYSKHNQKLKIPPSHQTINEEKFKTIYQEFIKNAEGVDKNEIFVGKNQLFPTYFEAIDTLQYQNLQIKDTNLQKIQELQLKRKDYIQQIRKKGISDQNLTKNIIYKKDLLTKYSYLILSSNLKILDNDFLSKYTCICDTCGNNDINTIEGWDTGEKGNQSKKKNNTQLFQTDSYGDIYILVHLAKNGVSIKQIQEDYMQHIHQKHPQKIIVCFNFSDCFSKLLTIYKKQNSRSSDDPYSDDVGMKIEKEFLQQILLISTFFQEIYETAEHKMKNYYKDIEAKIGKIALPNNQSSVLAYLQERIVHMSAFNQEFHKNKIFQNFDKQNFKRILNQICIMFPHQNIFCMADDFNSYPKLIQQFFKKSENQFRKTLIKLTKQQLFENYDYLNQQIQIFRKEATNINSFPKQLTKNEELKIIQIQQFLKQEVLLSLAKSIEDSQTLLSDKFENVFKCIPEIYQKLLKQYESYEHNNKRSNYVFKQSLKNELLSKIANGINGCYSQLNETFLKCHTQFEETLQNKRREHIDLNHYLQRSDLDLVQTRIQKNIKHFISEVGIQWQHFLQFYFEKFQQFHQFQTTALQQAMIHVNTGNLWLLQPKNIIQKLAYYPLAYGILYFCVISAEKFANQIVKLGQYMAKRTKYNITNATTVSLFIISFVGTYGSLISMISNKCKYQQDKDFFDNHWNDFINCQKQISIKCKQLKDQIKFSKKQRFSQKFKKQVLKIVNLNYAIDNEVMRDIQKYVEESKKFIAEKLVEFKA